MPKKTQRMISVVVFIYLIILTCIVLTTINQEIRSGQRLSSDSALYMFFYIQPFGLRDSFFMNFVSITVIPILSSYYFVFIKNNNEIYNFIQRIGYKRFIKMMLIRIFLFSSSLSIIVNILELILINWFYAPLSFNKLSLFLLESKINHFSTNSFVELLTYISLSAMGWGIYTIFILSIGLIVKKNSLYMPLGIVVGLGSILLTVAIGSQGKWITQFLNIIAIPNLISPGQLIIAGTKPPLGILLTFFLSAMLYSFFTYILIEKWCKNRKFGV